MLLSSSPLIHAQSGTYQQTVSEDLSYESFNFRNRYIRHRGMLGYVEPIPSVLGRRDATFKVVGGLAGTGDCVSFESVNYRTYYLRHENFRLKLSKRNNNDRRFLEDATFCIQPGLALGGISFESFSHRGHFIRHINFELWLHRFEDTEQFRKDATFIKTPPGGWKRPR
jgi:hypothetical protein